MVKYDYFECECSERNHSIRIPEDSFIDNSISMEFVVNYGYFNDHWYQNFWWRICKACKILFTGKIELYDEWIVNCDEAKRLADRLYLGNLNKKADQSR